MIEIVINNCCINGCKEKIEKYILVSIRPQEPQEKYRAIAACEYHIDMAISALGGLRCKIISKDELNCFLILEE